MGEILEVNVPPHSTEYVFSAITALVLGLIDIFIIMMNVHIFGDFGKSLITIIFSLMCLIFLLLLGHLHTRYILSRESLIIKTLFFKKEIRLESIKGLKMHRINYLYYLFGSLFPLYTVQDGLMIETVKGEKIFISPSERERFYRMIKDHLESL